MVGLITHHFLFTTEVVTPLKLEDHSGSALRGSFSNAVWRRFCANKASPTCAECPLHRMCPVSTLVAPLREENVRGRDIPRPYVILPPLGEARCYAPGEQLIFGLTLFGGIVSLLPYLMLSIAGVEAAGLGHKLQENDWQRGRFRVKKVESYHPFTAERRVIYEAGKAHVDAPTCSVTPADVQAKAAALSPERITLNFLTPTRLTRQEHPIHHVTFRPLIHRLMERLSAIEAAYGIGCESSSFDIPCFVELAESVQCLEDTTRWEELLSYSSRQQRNTSISGFLGKATFAGDLAPFLELLAWGELVHVGKNAVKGNGWYRIES